MLQQLSSRDGGTLVQLRNLINRKGLPHKLQKDTNACEDFLELVSIGHIVAAAMKLLSLNNMEDELSCHDITPKDVHSLSKEDKEVILKIFRRK